MGIRNWKGAPHALRAPRQGRRYRSGIRSLEDRVSLSASPWSQVDPEEVAALLAGRNYVADELVVAVQAGTGAQTFADILAVENALDAATAAAIKGATLLGSAASDAATQIYEVTLQAGVDLTGVISAMSKWSSVEWAAPNFIYQQPASELIPNDPSYGSQWNLAKMQAPAAWDITQGAGVIVAVMDDGVDWDHQDLAANIWNNSDEIAGNGIDDDHNGFVDDVRGWDFSSGDNNPDENGTDFHGTHVAGIIAAATNNGLGVSGVAGQATIMPVRFFGSGAWTSTVIFNSYKYAVDNGAKIINTSYDIDSFVGDSTFDAALNYAYSHAVLMFNSAGNNNQVSPPRGNWDQIIFVASTDQNDVKSSFSNTGAKIDVSAPGENIYSTLPNNTYGALSGTSMASPAAAAVAALIWAANPTWSRDQVAARLLGTADNLDLLNTGYADLLGTGRVNAYKALTQSPTAPVIESVSTSIVVGGTSTLAVQVDSRFDDASIENLSNWELRRDGADNIFGTADDVVVSLNRLTDYMVGSNEFVFSFNPSASDRYRLTARSGAAGLKDPFGVQLDGNRDGVAGDDYTFTFDVGANSPPAVTPIGDIVLNEDGSTTVAFGITDSDTPASQLTVTAISSNSVLLPNSPAGLNLVKLDDTHYQLGVTPTANAWGTGKITVSVSDGVNTTVVDVNLVVNAVNDAPSFSGRDINVWGGSAGLTTTIQNWATNISAGAGEAGQNLHFVVTTSSSQSFTTQPTVSPNGTLSFTRNGIYSASYNTITVTLVDDGGTANGGVNSFSRTFELDVDSGINIYPPPPTSISEDQTTGNIQFLVTDEYLNPLSNVSVNASSQSPGIIQSVVAGSLGNGVYYVSATPVANAVGLADIRLSAAIPSTTRRSNGDLYVNVTAVNDAPTFNLFGDLSVAADGSSRTYTGFASAISAGAANESGQSLAFQVTTDNDTLFDVLPSIAADGTLTFKAKADQPGSAVVTVLLKDDGGTAGGGVDTSTAHTFTINNVLSGNITQVDDRTILEDASTGPIPFSITWTNPTTTGRSVTVASSDAVLLPQANLTLVDLGSGNYTVAAVPASNRNGTVRVTITATDSGVSTTETFDLTVAPVNDVPSFTVGPNRTAGNAGVEQVLAGAATNLSSGVFDVGQSLSWLVTNDSPALFAVQPTMDANGALHFTPNAGVSGTAMIQLRLKDDGGTADGGVDTSAMQYFYLTLETRSAVTGRVWTDSVQDGIQADGESGAGGVVVELMQSTDGTAGNADDVSLGTTVSAADGSYAFYNVAPGSEYYLVVHTPPYVSLSPVDVGGDGTDSDFSPSTAQSAFFSLVTGQTVDLDAGVYGLPQDFGWVFGLGTGSANGGGSFSILKALLDDSGNTVLVGNYIAYGRDLNPGAGVSYLPFALTTSTFVVKLDAADNVVWSQAVLGAESISAALDASGNIVINGGYNGTVDFDPGAGNSSLTSPFTLSTDAGFVLKLSSAGGFLWAKSVGTANVASLAFPNVPLGDIAIGPSGEIVVVGALRAAADFDPGTGTATLTPTGTDDAYAVKLDQNGNFVWAQAFVGTGSAGAYAAAVDSSGNVFVGGNFFNTIDFDPGAGTANRTAAGTDAYVVKLTSAGALAWTDVIGAGGNEFLRDLAVTSSGEVVAVGYFSGATDLDPGAGTKSYSTLPSLNEDAFVVKLESGGAFEWGYAVGSTSTDFAYAVAIDGAGNILVAGKADLTVDFDPSAGVDIPAFSGPGAFLWTLNAAGAHVRVERVDSSGSFGVGIGVDAAGNYEMFGTFTSPGDFDPGPGTTLLTPYIGGASYYLTRRTAANSQVWSRQFGDASNLNVRAMATDSAGNVFISGTVDGTVDFDPAAGSAPSQISTQQGFLAEYTRDGALLWRRQFSGTASQLAVDASGNVVVGATVGSVATVYKFDNTGNSLWSKSWSGTTLQDVKFDSHDNLFVVHGTTIDKLDVGGNVVGTTVLDNVTVAEIAVAADGGLAITGYFSGTRDFDPGAGVFSLSTTSYRAMFVMRLDADGQLLWAFKRDGVTDLAGADLAFDVSGDLFVIGRYYVSDNIFDDYLLRLDAAGNEIWSRRIPVRANSSTSNLPRLVVDAAGHIIVASIYQQTVGIDAGITLSSLGGTDVYIARYDGSGNLDWVKSYGYFAYDTVPDLAFDDVGNLVIGGTYFGDVEADPGPGFWELTSNITPNGYSAVVGLVMKWKAAFLTPEINVTGNGVGIVAGDDTPSTGDFTDFGIVPVGGTAVTRQFVVSNAGNVDLLLNGNVRVEIGGPAAADFTVTALPASRIAMGATSTFDVRFSPTAEGVRDAVITIRNNDTDEPIYSFAVRGATAAPPPAHVLGVYAGSSAWTSNFNTYLQDQGLTDTAGWLELSRGAGQTDTLPWANVNQLRLQFAGLPALTQNDVKIVSSTTGVAVPAISNFQFDVNSQVATITFASNLPANKYLIYINGTVGNLDGEWTDNQSTASGDGTAGGDFQFRFDVLPGDIDRTKSVSFGEIGQQRLMLGRTTASSDYNYRQDYDGSGSITFGDVGLARGNLGQAIGSFAEPDPHALGSGGPESFAAESYGAEAYDPATDGVVIASAAPSITPISGQTILEDSQTQILTFQVSDSDTPLSNLSVTVTSSDPTLVPQTAQNLVLNDMGDGNYQLVVKPAADLYGSTSITVRVSDGTSSATSQFNLTVTPVNDAPSFYVGSDIVVPGVQQFFMYRGSVGPISTGAPNEGNQSLTFLVSVDHPELFYTAPQVEDLSTLTFTPREGVIGVATLTIRLQDNGGTANGGVDTSPPQTLKITFKAPPVFSAIADQTVDQGQSITVDFSVSDPDTPADQIVVSALSPSNPVLLPVSGLTLTNLGGGNWRVTATPVAGQWGTANIVLYGNDGDVVGSTEFKLTVNSSVPARVLGVYAGGTSWSTAFKSYLVSKGLSDVSDWLKLSRGPGQVDTLPWSSVNQLLIRFSNLPDLTQNEIRIIASADGPALPAITNVYFNQSTQFATISFAAPLPANKYLIYIDDVVGHLDGEWTDNVSTASGNGTAGGDFAFRFDVLPGDIDRSKSVAFGEIGQQRLMLGRTTASSDYNYRQDYDGSGSITFGDVGSARGNLGQGISTYAEPSPPVGAGGPESVALQTVGPESYGPESYGPAVAATSSADDAEAPINSTMSSEPTSFVVTTLEADVVAPAVAGAGIGARVVAQPVVTPSPAVSLGELELAKAWSASGSFAVAATAVAGTSGHTSAAVLALTVPSLSHHSVPGATAAMGPIRSVSLEPRFGVFSRTDAAAIDNLQAAPGPTFGLSSGGALTTRWTRLRRPDADGRPADSVLAVAAAGEEAITVE